MCKPRKTDIPPAFEPTLQIQERAVRAGAVFHRDVWKGSLQNLSQRWAVTSDLLFLMAKLIFSLATDPGKIL